MNTILRTLKFEKIEICFKNLNHLTVFKSILARIGITDIALNLCLV
jgi:hypothetical protein